MYKYLSIISLLLLVSINLFSQPGRYQTEIFSSYQLQSNITYTVGGTNGTQQLDIYTGTGDTATMRPLIIFIHGGGFKDGDKVSNFGTLECGGFAKRGYLVASINYRLTSSIPDDQTHFEAMLRALQDTKAAIRFFRRYQSTYKVDTTKIYLTGSSAGCITALHAAFLDSSEVPSYVNWSNVGNSFEGTSGNPGYSSKIHGVISNWGAIGDTSWMKAGDAPIYCVHGTEDVTVYYDQIPADPPFLHGSKFIYDRAQHLNLTSGLRLFYNTGHTLDNNATKQDSAYKESAAWLYTVLTNTTIGPATQLVFGVQPSNTLNNSIITPSVKVWVEDANGNIVTTDNTTQVTLAIGSNPGGGSLTGGGSVTVSGGVTTFSSLSINNGGTGYTLQASSSPSLTGATSNAFNIITVGAASKLSFGVQPSNTLLNNTIIPSVTVRVEDATGNLVTTDNTTQVTLVIGTNPGGGVLTGGGPVTVFSGVATFSSLAINAAGDGYTLSASSSPSLTGATSNTFNITSTAPTTVFVDDFNRSAYTSPQSGGTPTATYTTGTGSNGAITMRLWTGSDYGLQIAGTGAAGNTFTYLDNTVFGSPYSASSGLHNNSGLIQWCFNVRNYGSPTNYKPVMILAASSNDFNSGTGYAVYYGKTTTRRFSLVKFSGGVQGTVTDIIPELGTDDIAGTTNQDYASVVVTYDPSIDNWSMYVRDDGASVFTLPWTGTLTQHGSTISDNTYTSSSYNLMYSGFYYRHSTGVAATYKVIFDNFKVLVTPNVSPTLNVSPLTLNDFNYVIGNGPSSSKSYNLGGINLTGYSGNISVNGSTNYEVSSDNISFSSSVNIPFTSATLDATPVYVRLKSGLSVGTYNSETISCIGGGSSAYVTCNGYVLNPATTYTWTGATNNDWPTSTNWSPAKTIPAINDIVRFNSGGTQTITGIQTQTIGQLIVSNNTTVTLQSGAPVILTIRGDDEVDLDVLSGSALNLGSSNATNTITITLNSGTTGSIAGSMNFNADVAMTPNGHQLLAADGGAILFQSGAVFTAGTNFIGTAFGTTNLNSIVFAPGSTYIHAGGSSPFGAGQPSSVVTLQTGCLYKCTGTVGPSYSGRTYANFEVDQPTNTQNNQGSSPVTFDNFTVTNGIINWDFSGGVNIKGNISVGSGTTLTFGNATKVMNLTFNGISPQSLGGTGTLTFGANGTLVVNNAAGVTLNRSISLLGSLTLTAGKLTLGSNNLTLSSSTIISGGSSTSYVITNGAGAVTRQGVGAVDIAFPVGTTSSYLPTTINNAGTVDDYSVTVKSTFDNAPADPTKVVNAQWTITEGTTGGSNATLKLQWNTTNQASGFSPGGTVIVGRWDGSLWEEYSSTVSGANPYVATVAGITNFSPFIVGNVQSLPVQLASFIGNIFGSTVMLEWQTVSENNNYGFNIQRYNNAICGFETIGFVAGNGTTLTPQNYEYLDEAPNNTLKYRLEQIDNNGLKIYYGPIFINPSGIRDGNIVPAVFKLNQNYPNPFNPTTKISFSLEKAAYTTLIVYSVLGDEVATLYAGDAESGRMYVVNYDASNFASGLYFYKLQSGTQIEFKKFVFLK
jgi:hypothetical protein